MAMGFIDWEILKTNGIFYWMETISQLRYRVTIGGSWKNPADWLEGLYVANTNINISRYNITEKVTATPGLGPFNLL